MANTKVTGALIADATITATNIADGAVTAAKLTGITTTSIAEGDKLFYTDARVGTYLTGNGYDTANNIIATITDSAPATLDTLNELAAALGDDPNFATTVTNSIATKLPLSGGNITGNFSVDTNTLFVDAANNRVGVGTATPTAALDIDRAEGLMMRIKRTGVSGEFQMYQGPDAVYLDSAAAGGNLILATVATERMRIDSSGRVGIGTSSPSTPLHLAQNAANTFFTLEAYAATQGATAGINVAREQISGSESNISFWTNTGSALTEKMAITSSGNVAIGVVPAPSTDPSIQSRYGLFNGHAEANITSNATFYTSSWRYQSTGFATRYYANEYDGSHQWFTAASGTSGNAITFQERMRIDSSGNVGIGTQTAAGSNGKGLAIYTSDYPRLTFRNSATGDGIIDGTQFAAVGVNFEIYNKEAGNIEFGTSNLERMRIDSSGRVGIGVTPSTIWSTSYNALQIGVGGSLYAHSSAGNALKIGSNIVYEGTAPNYYDKYLNNSTATKYEQDSGTHSWHVASSGTTGNAVSWTEAMRIINSGNVGIGTTAPNAKLDVKGQIRSYAPTGQIYSYSTNAANDAVVFAGWTTGTGIQIKYNPNSAVGYVENNYPVVAGQPFGDIQFRQNVGGTMTPRMIIQADGGNVNIGTTGPISSGRLNIKTDGSAQIGVGIRLINPYGFASASTGVQIVFAQDRSEAENYEMAVIRSGQSIAGTSTNGDLRFFTRASDTVAERVRIQSTGGISFNGDTAAANALDDYEEGTFTPTVSSGTATISWAKYTKIGDLVFVVCELSLSGTRTDASFEVSGLPFTNGAQWTPCSFYAQYYLDEGVQQASGVFRASTNIFRVHEFGAETFGSRFGNGYFAFAGTYKVS